MFPYALAFRAAHFTTYTYVRDGHTAKKHAKVLLFFDMTKFFCKKIQKKCILYDLLGISDQLSTLH